MDQTMERLHRIYKIAESDAFYSNMKRENERENEMEQKRFQEYTAKLSEENRRHVWGYPGSMYFMYQRLLVLICEHMRFPDEEE